MNSTYNGIKYEDRIYDYITSLWFSLPRTIITIPIVCVSYKKKKKKIVHNLNKKLVPSNYEPNSWFDKKKA